MSENFLGKVAVKIFIRDDINRFLVVRQNQQEDYEVPGGRVDSGESIEDAIKRELFEELNVSIKNLEYKIENSFQAMNPHEGIQHLYLIISTIFKKEDIDTMSTTNEVKEMVWINKENYQKYKYKKFLEKHIENYIIKINN